MAKRALASRPAVWRAPTGRNASHDSVEPSKDAPDAWKLPHNQATERQHGNEEELGHLLGHSPVGVPENPQGSEEVQGPKRETQGASGHHELQSTAMPGGTKCLFVATVPFKQSRRASDAARHEL